MQVHGKPVFIRGTRCFAVQKPLSLTERIANTAQSPSNWDRTMRIPDPRLRNTRSIVNRKA